MTPPTIPPSILQAINQGPVDTIATYFDQNPTHINIRDTKGISIIRKAVISGNPHIVQALLKRKADITESWKCTHCSIEHTLLDPILTKHEFSDADWRIIQLLMGAGIGPNSMSPQEKITPIMSATYASNPHTIYRLMHHGADPTLRALNFSDDQAQKNCFSTVNNTTPSQVAAIIFSQTQKKYSSMQNAHMIDDVAFKKELLRVKKKLQASKNTVTFYQIHARHQQAIHARLVSNQYYLPKELVSIISGYLANEFPLLTDKLPETKALELKILEEEDLNTQKEHAAAKK